MSGRRTTNPALATPRIARMSSTIPRVRPGGAEEDTLWFTPSLQTKDRHSGVCDFRYARDTRIPGMSVRIGIRRHC